MAINFVEQQRSSRFDPPFRSLLDVDFYKFTMGNYIFAAYPDVNVTFELIVRDKEIPLLEKVGEKELRACFDYARTVSLTPTDLAFLRGMRVYGKNMFSEGYTVFLENFRLPPYTLEVVNGSLKISFSGKWLEVSMWETIALAIISELYYRSLMAEMSDVELEILYARAKDRIYTKLEHLRQYKGIRFADFGQRRRPSFHWHKWVVKLCRDMMGEQFTGTSNTWMAFNQNLTPIGTNAHELPMVLAALASSPEEMRRAQYVFLSGWEALYQQGLRIFLPDTFGTKQFLEGAPAWLANWRGMRQDSGDPIGQTQQYIRFLHKQGVNPKEKLVIFSDGLDDEEIVRYYKYFKDEINVAFGWGTNLTNDFRDCHTGDTLFRPFSMVCKVTEVNGRPAVKLSDNPPKATGPRDEIERYRDIFGTKEGEKRAVLV
jgi:nicotinate phosphoribosyltransferase